MRFLVDTNVISELGKKQPNDHVLSWLQEHASETKLSVITIKELYYGSLKLPEGKRKDSLLAMSENLVWLYSDDVLPFDSECALICARLHARAVEIGRTPQIEDLMTAAICVRNRLTLATRNTKDFDYLDIPVLNPFEGSS